MGCASSKKGEAQTSDAVKLGELSEGCMKKVTETFKIFDKDGSNEIDIEEALNHWKTKFGRISAKEFFCQVDQNKNGVINF